MSVTNIDRRLCVVELLKVECHPYHNQEDLLSFLKENDITLTAYSPFGNPGRPWKGTERDGENNDIPALLENATVNEIAKKHRKGPGHILLRFQIQRGVIVIPKSVTPSRIKSNYELFDFALGWFSKRE